MRFLMGFLCLLVASQGFAQMAFPAKGISTGTVIDKATGSAIPYAAVSIHSAVDTALVTGDVTDEQGQFLFSELAEGQFVLQIQVLGYTHYYSEPFAITLEDWTADMGRITLEPESAVLEAVVVKAVRQRMETIPGGFAVNVDERLAATNVDAGALLRVVPGVFIDQSGALELLGRPNVQVQVDGQLIQLTGRELMTFLQEIPSEDIVHILVRTTPSAAESAQGSAGIIEIKTNRKKKRGLIGRWSGELGSRDKYNTGIATMFNTDRLSVYSRFSYRHDNYIEKTTETYTDQLADQVLEYRERNIEELDSYGLQTSVDYAWNEHTTIGAAFRGRWATMENNPGAAVTEARSLEGTAIADNRILTTTNWANDRYFGNLNYRTTFGKPNHAFRAEYSFNHRDWFNDLLLEEQTISDNILTEDIAYTRNADFLVQVHDGRVDYSFPVTQQGHLEVGGRYMAAAIDVDLQNEHFDPIQGTFLTDAANSYLLDYQENIGAAYMNYKQQTNSWAFEIGLRAEHTAFELTTLGIDGPLRNTRNQWNVFPTALARYYISDQQSVSFSVGSRIDRPRFYTLNPYQISPNPNLEMRGNPALRPSLDYKADLSYALNWADRYSINVAAGYSYSVDPYTYVTIPQAETDNFLTTPENIDHSTFSYLSINSNNDLADWWSLSGNVFVNRITLDGSSREIEAPAPVVSYSMTLTNNFTLWQGANLQIHGGYKSPQTTLYGWANGYQMLDISFSKAFLANKLRLNIHVTDVFDINDNQFQYDTGALASEGRWKYETRVAYLRLSYTFGKRVASKAKRHRATEDSRYEE
jgi:hypothetical protein